MDSCNTNTGGCQMDEKGYCTSHTGEVERRRDTESLVRTLKDSIEKTQVIIDGLQTTLKTYPALQKTVWLIAGAQALVTLIITGSFIYTTLIANQSITRNHLLVGIIQQTQESGKELAESVAALRVKVEGIEGDTAQAQLDIKANRELHIKYDVPSSSKLAPIKLLPSSLHENKEG